MNKEDLEELKRILWYYRSFVDSEQTDGPDKNYEFDKIDNLMAKIELELRNG